MKGRYYPRNVIEFVGKTGFISREIWERHFFGGGKRRWKYQAWADLTARGYFLPYPNRRLRNVLVLNRKNAVVAELVPGRAVAPPGAAQIEHDAMLYEGLLTAAKSRTLSGWTSEPELKTHGGGALRIETQGQLIKYPDAVVQMHGSRDSEPIAIELEMTLKNRARYDQILSAYAAMNDVAAVVFICKAPVIERAIKDACKRTYFPKHDIRLVFASVQAWQEHPCIVFGDLQRAGSDSCINQGSTGLHSDCTVCRTAA